MAMEKLLVLRAAKVGMVRNRTTTTTVTGRAATKQPRRTMLPMTACHRDVRSILQSSMRPVSRPTRAPLIMSPMPMMPNMRLKAWADKPYTFWNTKDEPEI